MNEFNEFVLEDFKSKLKEMSLEDCANVIRESLSILYDKLREEGFGCEISIVGHLDDWPKVLITDDNDTSHGRSTYSQIFRL